MCRAIIPLLTTCVPLPRADVKPVGGGTPGIYFFTLDCSSLLPALGALLLFHLPYRIATIRFSQPDEQCSTAASSPSFASSSSPCSIASATFCASSARQGSTAAVHAEWETIGQPETQGAVADEAAFFVERYCLYNTAGPFLHAVAMPFTAKMWRGSITHKQWPVQRAILRGLQHNLLQTLGLQPCGDCLAHFSPGVTDIVFYWEAFNAPRAQRDR